MDYVPHKFDTLATRMGKCMVKVIYSCIYHTFHVYLAERASPVDRPARTTRSLSQSFGRRSLSQSFGGRSLSQSFTGGSLSQRSLASAMTPRTESNYGNYTFEYRSSIHGI